MADNWIEDRHEHQIRDVLRDTRPITTRIGDWLLIPKNFATTCIVVGAAAIPLAAFSLFFIPVILTLWWWYAVTGKYLPIRYPQDLGGMDPSHMIPGVMPAKPADGIYYLGNLRGTGVRPLETWENNSDSRMHYLVMGATGSGKTEFLLGMAFNGLCWGSGFMFTDGKADNSLWAKAYSLARRVGLDDNVLVINFLMGGRDAFANNAKSTERTTNSLNPFYDASADFNSQLVQSLLTKVTGDGAQWQQKAVTMFDAVVTALSYLRSKGEVEVSIQSFREYIALDKLIELYLRDDLPEEAYIPIKSYLVTGLPGFDPQRAKAKKPQDNVVLEQHGYRTGAFSKTFAMLADTYGHIFACRYADVDMTDVVLNRRILVVMIPSLERSPQEASNLGKLAVAAVKLMMAKNLGDKLEGLYEDVVERKATNSPSPYNVIMDELGYYFSPGIDIQFAQGRSLGFNLIAAGQDFQAMAKGENKNEVESMIANTKTKIALAMEDPKETFEIFQKAADEAYVSQVSGYTGKVSAMLGGVWQNMMNAGIERRTRITLRELRALKNGQAVVLFWDKVLRLTTFYVFGKAKIAKRLRLNVFLEIYKPDLQRVVGRSIQIERKARSRYDELADTLRSDAPEPPELQRDPMIEAVAKTVRLFRDDAAKEEAVPVPAVDRGIAYYQAALQGLNAALEDLQVAEPVGGPSAQAEVEPVPVVVADPGEKVKEIAGVQIGVDDDDILSFLDCPPVTIKPVEDDSANQDHQAHKDEKTGESEQVRETPDTTKIAAAVEFTEEAKDALKGIEELLGNPEPEKAVASIEAEVTRAMQWVESDTPQAISTDDIEDVFAKMESLVSKSAGEHK